MVSQSELLWRWGASGSTMLRRTVRWAQQTVIANAALPSFPPFPPSLSSLHSPSSILLSLPFQHGDTELGASICNLVRLHSPLSLFSYYSFIHLFILSSILSSIHFHLLISPSFASCIFAGGSMSWALSNCNWMRMHWKTCYWSFPDSAYPRKNRSVQWCALMKNW